MKAGKLPQISWIAAPEAFTEHPNWPANYGAWYIAQVLDALTSNPEVWSRTALFITYDENDGFFDHVVPPLPAGIAPAQGLSTVDTALDLFAGNAGYAAGPYGLGQRVPMLVVSPWSTGGYVCSETFDHTSIIRFMERRFGVAGAEHLALAAGDLRRPDLGVRLRPAATPGPPACPDTDAYEPPDNDRHPDYVPKPPADRRPAEAGEGQRPRPAAAVRTAGRRRGRLRRPDASRSPSAAVRRPAPSSWSRLPNRTDGPWTYTTAAGKTISDTWNTAYSKGAYDLTVHGPNGFVRTLKGSGSVAGPEVTARHVAGGVELTMTNAGSSDRRLTVIDAYGGRRQTFTVRPGGRVVHTVDVRAGKRWYDITVVSDKDGGFLRRFAGHVENGRPGVSDPAIITV